MLRTRQATSEDSLLIQQVLLQKIDELAARGIEQWTKKELLDELDTDYTSDNFYLVYQENEIVGLFCVLDYDPGYWRDDLPKEALYIHKVTVLDKARGTGVSDYILDEFKQLGRIANVKSVKLDVRAHKEKLRSYYERNGFLVVRIVDLNKGYLTALYEYVL